VSPSYGDGRGHEFAEPLSPMTPPPLRGNLPTPIVGRKDFAGTAAFASSATHWRRERQLVSALTLKENGAPRRTH